MSESGWLTIATAVFGAISAGAGFLVKALLGAKDATIAKQDAEIAAYRLKIDKLQDEILSGVTKSLESERKRAETDTRVARSIEEQAALIKALVAGKPA